ncbi:GNAT family N-acetyltransferase [Candidatus Poribacteria bacterium]|nr:GNAT family N-acetyltransferase [Candidatus Poribacteria bacterium]
MRIAHLNDIEPLSRLLARAFHHDPFHCWLFPCSKTRMAKHQKLFFLTLRPRIRRGAVFTSDCQRVVAAWTAPDDELSLFHFLSSGLPCLSLMGGRAPLAVVGFLKTVARQPRHPHFYLSLLAVDPPFQGQGLGSDLLFSLLSLSDQKNVPVYLEATSEGSFRFYQRHGFQLSETLQLPYRGPTLWLMNREPNHA